MKNFYKTNTITRNLLSLTGFKAMIVFSLLVESPKSYEEIQKYFQEHEYIRENIARDTIRVYLNTLQTIGCSVQKIGTGKNHKYYIDSHPFQLAIDDEQTKSIIKIYKEISKSIELQDLITLQSFFIKISKYITNKELKEKLKSISPIGNIDPEILRQLITYVENKAEITIYYNSPVSGFKNITVLTDKINIENGKLYLHGFNQEHKNYAKFLVSKITKIVSVNIADKTINTPEITIGYEYKKEPNEPLELLSNEKIISETDSKLVIEMTSRNKFDLMQRVMFHSEKCRVLYPEDFKSYIVATLEKMKEEYHGR